MINNDKISGQTAQTSATMQYSASFLDDVEPLPKAPIYPNYILPNNTLPNNTMPNSNNSLVMNDVFAMPETMPKTIMAKPSDNPDYKIRYNGDGRYDYSLDVLKNKLERDFGTAIDTEKLAIKLNVTAQDKGMLTDEDLYTALDTGAMAKNGILEKDELEKLVNETKKQPTTYSNDSKDSYAVRDFIAKLEKKYNVPLDEIKLRQLLGHTFLDGNKPITDADLRKFDINNNGNLENTELLSLVDKIKKSETVMPNNLANQELETKLTQLIELVTQLLMQQQMSSIAGKPQMGMGSMPQMGMGSMPTSYQSVLGTVNAPMSKSQTTTQQPMNPEQIMAMMNMLMPK